MKKILIGLALIIISTALFSQNLTFVSNQITYDVFGESGEVSKNSVIKIYDDKATIIQENETLYLRFVTEMEESHDERFGGITTMNVLCEDEHKELWLLGISHVKDLEQFIITLYQHSEVGDISLMFFGQFKEDANFNKNETRMISFNINQNNHELHYNIPRQIQR
jgi:hypothetical protein